MNDNTFIEHKYRFQNDITCISLANYKILGIYCSYIWKPIMEASTTL